MREQLEKMQTGLCILCSEGSYSSQGIQNKICKICKSELFTTKCSKCVISLLQSVGSYSSPPIPYSLYKTTGMETCCHRSGEWQKSETGHNKSVLLKSYRAMLAAAKQFDYEVL